MGEGVLGLLNPGRVSPGWLIEGQDGWVGSFRATEPRIERWVVTSQMPDLLLKPAFFRQEISVARDDIGII